MTTSNIPVIPTPQQRKALRDKEDRATYEPLIGPHITEMLAAMAAYKAHIPYNNGPLLTTESAVPVRARSG